MQNMLDAKKQGAKDEVTRLLLLRSQKDAQKDAEKAAEKSAIQLLLDEARNAADRRTVPAAKSPWSGITRAAEAEVALRKAEAAEAAARRRQAAAAVAAEAVAEAAPSPKLQAAAVAEEEAKERHAARKWRRNVEVDEVGWATYALRHRSSPSSSETDTEPEEEEEDYFINLRSYAANSPPR